MKKLILSALALFALSTAAHAAPPLTYVHVATWTAAGAATRAFAFQNTSAGLDVIIRSIEIGNASQGTVTSGPMQFWVYGSTAVYAHGGTTQVSFYNNASANATAPSYISFSTGPVGVAYEGKQTRQLPIARLIVNADETAVVAPDSMHDSIVNLAPDDITPLVLPQGANRALVVEQKQLGATDWTAGDLFVRIVYTVR